MNDSHFGPVPSDEELICLAEGSVRDPRRKEILEYIKNDDTIRKQFSKLFNNPFARMSDENIKNLILDCTKVHSDESIAYGNVSKLEQANLSNENDLKEIDIKNSSRGSGVSGKILEFLRPSPDFLTGNIGKENLRGSAIAASALCIAVATGAPSYELEINRSVSGWSSAIVQTCGLNRCRGSEKSASLSPLPVTEVRKLIATGYSDTQKKILPDSVINASIKRFATEPVGEIIDMPRSDRRSLLNLGRYAALTYYICQGSMDKTKSYYEDDVPEIIHSLSSALQESKNVDVKNMSDLLSLDGLSREKVCDQNLQFVYRYLL